MDPMFKGFRYLSLSLFLVLLGLLAKGKEKVSLEPVPYTGYAKTWLENRTRTYLELEWLADQNVHVTQESVGAVSDYSPSYVLYKKFYPEFDRTVLTLKALEIFLRGNYRDYLFFTHKQDPQFRLKYGTFKEIQKLFISTLEELKKQNCEDIERLLECYILFSDLGKTKTARKLAAEAGVKEGNLDLFFCKVASLCPEMYPSYKKLSPVSKKIIVQLAKQIHFGHIAHFEGGAELFKELEQSGFLDNSILVDLAFIGHICDVAGAQGHVDPCTSLNYNEKTHQLLLDVREACKNIKTYGSGRAWGIFLQTRAKALELGTEGRMNHVLLRIGSMMRLTTPYEAYLLKKSLFRLDLQEIENIQSAFKWENKICAKYIPAVLLNLFNNPNLGNNLTDRIERTVELGLPLIASSINQHTKSKSMHPTLNFNPVAKVAKENPQALQKEAVRIDQKGVVRIEEKLI